MSTNTLIMLSSHQRNLPWRSALMSQKSQKLVLFSIGIILIILALVSANLICCRQTMFLRMIMNMITKGKQPFYFTFYNSPWILPASNTFTTSFCYSITTHYCKRYPVLKHGKVWLLLHKHFKMNGHCFNLKGSRTAVFLFASLTHCILVEESTVIRWTNLFVILGVFGLFCCISIFDGKFC